MRAHSIATKGHFYQIDSNLTHRLASIVDHANNTVVPNQYEDETWLGLEKYSGVTIQARVRIMASFMYEKNNATLFSHFDEGYVIPFIFVQRDSIMTNDQVSEILGLLILAARVKTPF